MPGETTDQLLRDGVERLRASGSETARLDAELLLGDAVGVGRTVILAHPEAPVGADAAARYLAGLARRATGEPVAYIRGMKEFYGLAFAVDARALIPRPETERLVELAEAEVRRRLPAVRGADDHPIRLVDVGTGSGAVVVALAVAIRRLRALDRVDLVATDVSEDALDLARENAVAHAVADAIAFERGDLLRGTGRPSAEPAGATGPSGAVDWRFDVVLANLPYVRHDALPGLPIAASFEPPLALDGGSDGLAVIERLLGELPSALAEDGVALLEIGADQGEAIVERCAAVLRGWQCTVELDLAGLPRIARIART
jgi:release factor glutamine methyltransferase